MTKQHHNQPRNIFEGLRAGDLKGMVSHRFSIDKFTSKMGDDSNILVIAFKVHDKFPAIDLMEFIERGYPEVLDADMSTGEESDGGYSVFLEIERNDKAVDLLSTILQGIGRLCSIDTWRFKYFKDVAGHDFTKDTMKKEVPLSKSDYIARVKTQKVSDVSDVLNQGSAEIADIDESNNLTFSRPFSGDLTVKLESIGEYAQLKDQLLGKIQLDETAISQVAFLEKYLGNYEIHKIENKFLIRNGSKAVIIQKDRW